MWLFLGGKCNGYIIVDIREVLKVNVKVIWVSKSALGAERRTFVAHRTCGQHVVKYTTSLISFNDVVVIKSQNRVWYVIRINESRNYYLGNILFALPITEFEAGRHAYAKDCRSQASWSVSKRSTEVCRTHQCTGHSISRDMRPFWRG